MTDEACYMEEELYEAHYQECKKHGHVGSEPCRKCIKEHHEEEAMAGIL